MSKKELKTTFAICVIALLIGGLAFSFKWLNEFMGIIGCLILIAATIGILAMASIWHLYNVNDDNLKKSNIVSISWLSCSILGVLIGTWTKLTFICVVCGVFALYNFIALVLCIGVLINLYADNGITKEKNEEKEKNEIAYKSKIKIE